MHELEECIVMWEHTCAGGLRVQRKKNGCRRHMTISPPSLQNKNTYSPCGVVCV
eukprot:m.218319 g.218319  ORF g.218319 m.218319 type:complete len:54 (-) comp33264_c1_seq1:94-255(-)